MKKILFLIYLVASLPTFGQLKQGDTLNLNQIKHLSPSNGTWELDSIFTSKMMVFVFTDLKTPEIITLKNDLDQINTTFKEVQLIIVDEGNQLANFQSNYLQFLSNQWDLNYPLCTDTANYLFKQTSLTQYPSILVVNPNGKVLGSRTADNLFYQFESNQLQLFSSVANFSTKSFFNSSNAELLPYGKLTYHPQNNYFSLTSFTDNTISLFQNKPRKGINFSADKLLHPTDVNFIDSLIFIVSDPLANMVFKGNVNSVQLEPFIGNGQVSKYSSNSKTFSDPLPAPFSSLPYQENVLISSLGMFQIWDFYPADSVGYFYAGDGYKAAFFLDGYRYDARLAYPTNMTLQNGRIVFADAGLKKIRTITNGKLKTPSFYYGTKLLSLTDFCFGNDQLFVLDGYQKKIFFLNEKEHKYELFIDLYKLRGIAQSVFPIGITNCENDLLVSFGSNKYLKIDLKTGKIKKKKLKL